MITKRALRLFGICLFTLAVSLPLATAQAEEEQSAQDGAAPANESDWSYTVRPGDVLSIMVWKEPDLMRQVIVRPDGGFSFPLAGNISTDGKSVEEIEAIVTEKLERFIPDPVVTVATEQILGNTIYVIGQVQRPGQFTPVSRIDVTQALSLGGGVTPFAQVNEIKILRRVGERLIAIPFDFRDIEKGKRLQQNIYLEPGDVVLVP